MGSNREHAPLPAFLPGDGLMDLIPWFLGGFVIGLTVTVLVVMLVYAYWDR